MATNVKAVIVKAGGAQAVANHFDLSKVSVYKWIWNERVPAERVNKLSELSGIAPSEIRPDLFKTKALSV